MRITENLLGRTTAGAADGLSLTSSGDFLVPLGDRLIEGEAIGVKPLLPLDEIPDRMPVYFDVAGAQFIHAALDHAAKTSGGRVGRVEDGRIAAVVALDGNLLEQWGDSV